MWRLLPSVACCMVEVMLCTRQPQNVSRCSSVRLWRGMGKVTPPYRQKSPALLKQGAPRSCRIPHCKWPTFGWLTDTVRFYHLCHLSKISPALSKSVIISGICILNKFKEQCPDQLYKLGTYHFHIMWSWFCLDL